MSPKSQGAVTALDLLDGIMTWGMYLAAAAVVLISGYYIYGTVAASDQLFRGLAGPAQQMSPQEFQRHVANLQLLTKLLVLAAVILSVCALGRYYPMPETGAVLALVGAALFFGMPLLIDNMGGPAQQLPRALRGFGDPRTYLKGQFALSGLILIGVGGAQLLVHAVLFAVTARQRRPKANEEASKTAQQVRKSNDKFMGPCWELPFCRDTEKKLCPIRQSKRSCWRTGRGCYCDQNVILTLSGGNQYNASRGAAGYLSRTATVARPKSLREKREQCLQCPVYLHHQGQKYKVLAPGVVVGIVGATAYFWANLQTVYPNAMQTFGRAMSGLSFGTKAGEVPVWATDLAGNQILGVMILLVAAMVAIAYLLHAVEWTLYRLGI